MRTHAWTGPLVALSFLLPLAHGAEFGVGQSVVVVPKEASLYVGSEVVATVRQGDRLIVTKVQGKWVGVMSKEEKGWLRPNQIRVPPRPAPEPVERPTPVPVPPRETPKPVERPVTLKGHFTEGGHRHQHDLRGVFSRTGSKQWDVAFHFVWGKNKHVYKGTVTGDLQDGPVQGQARSGGRTWVFAGMARDGTLSCKHYETTGGKRHPTGDFLIRR